MKKGLLAVPLGQFGEKARCSLRGCVHRASDVAVRGTQRGTLVGFTSPNVHRRLASLQTDTAELDEQLGSSRRHRESEATDPRTSSRTPHR